MANKIKIIYVTAALEVGGAEMFLYDLVKHIDCQSFDVAVATVIGGGSLEPRFKALGAPIFVFGGRYSKLLGGICEACKLYRLFKKEKPDIVHTQLFPADLWGRVAAKLAGVPHIVTTEQNINVDQNCLRELLKRQTYKLADKVVAISTAVKKYTQERYRVPVEKIEIIPNDVDFEKFFAQDGSVSFVIPIYPASGGAEVEGSLFVDSSTSLGMTGIGQSPKQKKIILTVGRLVLQKGQKYLLEAFSILNNKDTELWLAGEGDLRMALEKQVRDLKIDGQVKFLGRRPDVPALLAQADLFVFPSEWEGLGVAILEAAAARVPIVTTAVDGILDIVDKDSARLVPPKDSRALAAAIEFMLANPDKAQAMAERAYDQVKNNFDIKVVVGKYENLYRRLVK